MTAAHTPGPWRADAPGYASHEFYVRMEWRQQGGPKIHGSAGAIAKLPPSKFHNQAANAQLIATAPDLLAFARQIADCEIPEIDEYIAEARYLVSKATGNAAIAAAEGSAS